MAGVHRPSRSMALSVMPAAAVPLIGFLLFTSTGRDDAYITYWAARSLAKTGEITNYNGARLEQSSSLFQTVVLAGLNRITTASIPAIGLWLGVVAGVATAVLAARVAERIRPGSGVTAGALTAASPFLVYWSFGGLEAPLVAFLLLATAWAAAGAITKPMTRSLGLLAVVTICFVTVRPEADLVFGCAALAALVIAMTRLAPAHAELRGPRRWLAPALVLQVGVLASVVLIGWRKAYFGSAQPQTVRAKVNGVHLGDGWSYVRLWWVHWWMLPLLIVAAAGVVLVVRRRQWLSTMVVLLLAADGGFVLLTGGDWMEAGRFLVPLVPLVAVLVAVAIHHLPAAGLRRALCVGLVASQVYGAWWLAANWSTGRPAWSDISAALPAPDLAAANSAPWYERDNRVHFRDRAFLGHLEQVLTALSRRQERVTVASGQAGMLPYYFMQNSSQQHLVFIDRGSLTTDSFRHCSHALIHSSLGAALPLSYWFSHTSECRLPLPDVIYGVGIFNAIPGLASHYILVYQQPATPIRPDARPRGPATTGAEYVAERNDLAPGRLSQ